ncbi:MAG TPA: GNAT family N-acetyltransferase [Acidimicrobiales bacterium]|jgi:GNAT superfamily N-acetyltransferase|nr:GNAT family N-acetyltransferase [Acidimicrobiales bacterium]
MSELRVAMVDAPTLYDLRRRVLRENNPDVSVEFVDDHTPSSRHFGGLLDDRLVASASFFPGIAPIRPELESYQLRFMAVDFDVQGRGFGAVMLEAAEERLRDLGAEQLWANARDRALGFYVATGWAPIEGSENVSPLSNLPHTKIAKLLNAP